MQKNIYSLNYPFTSPGLWRTLQNLPKHGVALVITDQPSKDLNMEAEITKLRDSKEIKIFVVLSPSYKGKIEDDSWNVYKRLSEGRIYNMASATCSTADFLEQVAQVIGEYCEGTFVTEVAVANESIIPVKL